MLSVDGQGVAVLMAVLGVSRTTVFAWFERGETGGLAGLANVPGQGPTPVLTAANEQPVRQAVEQNRQKIKALVTTLCQELNKKFSPKTLKRFFKSLAGRGDGFGMA